jgi:two-component system response regulator MprA
MNSDTMRILIVDDDPEIVNFVRTGLVYEGYTVDAAASGAEALARAREKAPDLVVLDVMMPGLSGIEVAKRLRQAGSVPILMLTAKGTTADKVAGLESGADDYLVKPFDFEELLARIRALLRRNQPAEAEVLRYSDLTLNTATREVTRAGRDISLTPQEFDLLVLFLRNPRQVLKRDLIYERVWGYDFEGESNVIEVYVRYLRNKLEAGGSPLDYPMPRWQMSSSDLNDLIACLMTLK